MSLKMRTFIFLLIMFSFLGCQKYNLTVDLGSGSGEYAKGDVVQIAANEAEEGFQFYRWEGDSQYLENRYKPNTSVKMDKTSIILKAVFVSVNETYSLTVSDGTNSGDYLPGDDIRIAADYVNPPEEFFRWTADCNLEDLNISNNDLFKSEIVVKMPRKDVIISAQFDILYKVLIMGGTGSGKYPKDSIVTIKANQAEEGYVFDTWVGDVLVLSDASKESLKFTMPEENIELEATYKLEPKYKLEIINGSGSGKFKAGKRQRITANPAEEGYSFVGWIGDTDVLLYSTNYKTYVITMPDRDIRLEATYEKTPDFLVTVNNGTGGGRYKKGQVVDVEADEASEGFEFSHWEGNDSLLEDKFASSTSFVMPKRAVTITAKFKEYENFTVTPVGASLEDGFFALKVFNNKLYAGAFGYFGGPKIFLYSNNRMEQVNPGIVVGESVCALEEFKGMLYANTEDRGKIFRTQDGSNWQQVYDAPNVVGCAFAVLGDYLYATNSNFDKAPGHIYRTSDGVSWKKVYDSGGRFEYIREIVSFKGKLYAFHTTGGLVSDNGTNWHNLRTPARMFRSHVIGDKILFASGKMYSSTNESAIWSFDGSNFTKLYSTASKSHIGNIWAEGKNILAITTVEWKGKQGGATLILSCDEGKTFNTVHTFNETEGWAIEKYNGAMFVGTKQDGGGGQIYKVTGLCKQGGEEPLPLPGDCRKIDNTANRHASADGFLWKPVSEGDGRLVILYPSSSQANTCTLYDTSGTKIEVGKYAGRTNGNRPTFRFSRSGSGYQSGTTTCGTP